MTLIRLANRDDEIVRRMLKNIGVSIDGEFETADESILLKTNLEDGMHVTETSLTLNKRAAVLYSIDGGDGQVYIAYPGHFGTFAIKDTGKEDAVIRCSFLHINRV